MYDATKYFYKSLTKLVPTLLEELEKEITNWAVNCGINSFQVTTSEISDTLVATVSFKLPEPPKEQAQSDTNAESVYIVQDDGEVIAVFMGPPDAYLERLYQEWTQEQKPPGQTAGTHRQRPGYKPFNKWIEQRGFRSLDSGQWESYETREIKARGR